MTIAAIIAILIFLGICAAQRDEWTLSHMHPFAYKLYDTSELVNSKIKNSTLLREIIP